MLSDLHYTTEPESVQAMLARHAAGAVKDIVKIVAVLAILLTWMIGYVAVNPSPYDNHEIRRTQ